MGDKQGIAKFLGMKPLSRPFARPLIRPLAFAAIAVAALALTACTSGDTDGPDATASAAVLLPSPPASTPLPQPSNESQSFDKSIFCERAEPMMVLVEREFVGSDAHVEQFVALSEVAPEDLVGVIDRMEEFYRTSVSPAEPESQNWDNFPASIQADAIALVDGITEICEAAA